MRETWGGARNSRKSRSCVRSLLSITSKRANRSVESIRASLFIEIECRMCEPAHQRRNFLQAACGPGQGIERLKAEQGKEGVNCLVERLYGSKHLLLDKPLCDHAYPLTSSFVSCPYHVLTIRTVVAKDPDPAIPDHTHVPKA